MLGIQKKYSQGLGLWRAVYLIEQANESCEKSVSEVGAQNSWGIQHRNWILKDGEGRVAGKGAGCAGHQHVKMVRAAFDVTLELAKCLLQRESAASTAQRSQGAVSSSRWGTCPFQHYPGGSTPTVDTECAFGLTLALSSTQTHHRGPS